MQTPTFTWLQRIHTAALTLVLSLLSASVYADTIHARVASSGLNLQLTSLAPGGVPTLEEVERHFFMDGYIYSPTLRVFGFSQSTPGNPFPMEHQFDIDDSVNSGVVSDSTGRGAVELTLAPAPTYADRTWSSRSTSLTSVALWIGPATSLTVSTSVEGMVDLIDPADNIYETSARWTLRAYSPLGNQGLIFGVGFANGQQLQFPVSDEDYLQLVISNPTAEPIYVTLESLGEVLAKWEPTGIVPGPLPVPEPGAWHMLLLGLAVIAGLGIPRVRLGSRNGGRSGLRCARLAFGALVLPVAAAAQTLDITATIGPASSQSGSPLVFTWDQFEIISRVGETGYPYVGVDRGASGTIPYPLEVAPRSGNSWVNFGVAGPSSAAKLQAHLELHEITIPHTESSIDIEIRGWIANIAVPAHSIGNIAMQIDFTPDYAAGQIYTVSGSVGTPYGTNYWTSSATGPDGTTIFSIPSFDNSTGTVPLNTGPVYFGASLRAAALLIPEPSRAWMLSAGLILLLGIAARNRHCTRVSAP